MVYQGFFEILMITLISRKKLGGYKIMRYTVISPVFQKFWQAETLQSDLLKVLI